MMAACLRASLAAAVAAILASPGALALSANPPSPLSPEQAVPNGLLLALRHEHGRCSVRVPKRDRMTEEERKHLQDTNVAVMASALHNASTRQVQKRGRMTEEERRRFRSMSPVVQAVAGSALQRAPLRQAADFTGTWALSTVDGDMDKLMLKMGVPSTEREAAKMLGYGAGHVMEKIKQTSKQLIITVKSALGTERKRYNIGAITSNQAVATSKRKVQCATNWGNEAKTELVVDQYTEGGRTLPQMRRSVASDTMLVRMILDGVIVTMTYVRIPMSTFKKR